MPETVQGGEGVSFATAEARDVAGTSYTDDGTTNVNESRYAGTCVDGMAAPCVCILLTRSYKSPHAAIGFAVCEGCSTTTALATHL